jgi:hypothetical protein
MFNVPGSGDPAGRKQVVVTGTTGGSGTFERSLQHYAVRVFVAGNRRFADSEDVFCCEVAEILDTFTGTFSIFAVSSI